jgi:putative addiction module component (TIGR02574 family)
MPLVMDQKSQEVLEAALTLPEGDRARIVEVLLQTLSAETDEREDDELVSELVRRLEEALNDPSSAMPWSELKQLS